MPRPIAARSRLRRLAPAPKGRETAIALNRCAVWMRFMSHRGERASNAELIVRLWEGFVAYRPDQSPSRSHDAFRQNRDARISTSFRSSARWCKAAALTSEDD